MACSVPCEAEYLYCEFAFAEATSSVHFEDQLSLSQQVYPSSIETKASWHPAFAVAAIVATTNNIRIYSTCPNLDEYTHAKPRPRICAYA